jgi:K+-transporting ATPase KdpF subunit
VGFDLHRNDYRPVCYIHLVHARLRQGVRLIMNFETVVGLVLAILGLIYLLYALIRAEDL